MARETKTEGDEFELLKRDVAALRDDLKVMSEHLKTIGETAVRGARARGAAKIDEARAELDEMVKELRQHGQDSVDSVERAIQDRPLVSVLAALGLGLILARLFERR